jgi:5'-nucleotidase
LVAAPEFTSGAALTIDAMSAMPPRLPLSSSPTSHERARRRSRPAARRLLVLIAMLALSANAAAPTTDARPATAPTRGAGRLRVVQVLGFSDYHSHAVPFWSEGKPNQAGVARAIAYLRTQRAQPHTLVLAGGDMLNKGVPAWSDAYRCVEWPWFDGLVDALALGNHDLDYGAAVFEECRRSVRFPVLSANLLGTNGAPYLTAEGYPYLVRDFDGVRVGAFAVAGPDVQRLLRPGDLPPGTRFEDATETARKIVATLRDVERVDAVVLFGHQSRAEDEALARAVPGIDLVLGSHSHFKGALTRLPGTRTSMLSSYQYLTYIAQARLIFAGRRLLRVEGRLVRLDETMPEDPVLAARVNQLQGELRAQRPERFARVGHVLAELSDAGLDRGESGLGNWVADVVRDAAGAHAFFSTASSFRGALPPGPLTLEDLFTAVPYTNRVVQVDLTGRELLELLALSVARRGSDGFSVTSGLRYTIRAGQIADVQVLRDPAQPARGYAPLEPEQRYRVASTDYQSARAEGYRDFFAARGAGRQSDRGLDVHTLLLRALEAGPVQPRLDGRVRVEDRTAR